MSIPGSVNPLFLGAAGQATESGYQIERSLRFNSPDSAYLSRTPASSSNRKTWSWAGWVKRSQLSTFQRFFWATGECSIRFEDDNTLRFSNYTGSFTAFFKTTAVYRDVSAWYHIVLVVDTTNATSTERLRLYVNNERVTAFSSTTYPTQNLDLEVNTATAHNIGGAGGSEYFSGYLADIHFIDGQALTPSSFTEVSATTGQLVPIEYTGSYGTNGFKLKFSDNSAATAATLGADTSGNGNNWTPNNLSVTAGAGNDSLVDTPTSGSQVDTGLGGQVTGNYATFNPINLTPSSSHSLTNGNLEVIGGTGWTSDVSTFPTGATGKWYAEITLAGTFATAPFIGIAKNTSITSSYIGSTSDSYGYRADATKWNGGSSAYGAAYTAGDTIGIAYDADAGTLVFYKNGVSQGTSYSGLSGSFFIGGSFWTSSTTVNAIANFGQRQWAYAAPAGFKALCDTNLPAPPVAKPNTVMDVVTYTGNATFPRSITGLNFNPDLIWTKIRSQAYRHMLSDSVRGTGRSLTSNNTDAESVNDAYGSVSAFNADGWSIQSGSISGENFNQSGQSYVAWTWDAGSSTDPSNTAGSITSQVRANVSAGFSVVTYTGTGANASVGHGLGVAPTLFIVKRRDSAANWIAHTTAIDGSYDYLYLNLTNAKADSGLSAPTSTIFQVGNGLEMNGSGATYVAYCFAPVAGYSAFGSYTGNGSATGPFVYTGMRPRWVLTKKTSATEQWFIIDTARDTYNQAGIYLYPNASNADADWRGVYSWDILSNGFIPRAASGSIINDNGATYIYAAFAESSFKYSRAR